MHPEMAMHESYVLNNGSQLQIKDIARSFEWRAFEYAPRPTRPLSSLMEMVDIKFRVWLWNFYFPHPSLSLTWLFSLILSPILLYLFFKNINIPTNSALASIALYLISPGLLSCVFMMFRPAKPMTSFLCIAAFYLASSPRKNYLFLLATILMGIFFDESAILIIPFIFILFPELLRNKTIQKGTLIIALLFFSLQFYVFWIMHYIPNGEGVPQPPAPFWLIYPWNTQILFFESLGMSPLSKDSSFIFPLFQVLCIIVYLIFIFFWYRNRHLTKTPSALSWNKLFWILLTASVFHAFSMSLVQNKVWGVYYYANYWSILVSLLWARLLTDIKLKPIWIFLAVGILISFLFLFFLKTNLYYKKFHYYPYSPLSIRGLYTNYYKRFRPDVLPAFSDKELKDRTKHYLINQKSSILPKELIWLYMEKNPGSRFSGKDILERTEKRFFDWR
jgi:hypothetical protein